MASHQHAQRSSPGDDNVDATLALRPKERNALIQVLQRPQRGNSSTRLGELVPESDLRVQKPKPSPKGLTVTPAKPKQRLHKKKRRAPLPDEAATVFSFDEQPKPKPQADRQSPRQPLARSSASLHQSPLPELSLSDLLVEDHPDPLFELLAAPTAEVLALTSSERPPDTVPSDPSRSGHPVYSTSDPFVRTPERRDPASDALQLALQKSNSGFVSEPIVAAWAFERTALEGPGVPLPWPPTVGPQRYVATQIQRVSLGCAGIAEPAAAVGRVAWTLVAIAFVMATAALGAALA